LLAKILILFINRRVHIPGEDYVLALFIDEVGLIIGRVAEVFRSRDGVAGRKDRVGSTAVAASIHLRRLITRNPITTSACCVVTIANVALIQRFRWAGHAITARAGGGISPAFAASITLDTAPTPETVN